MLKYLFCWIQSYWARKRHRTVALGFTLFCTLPGLVLSQPQSERVLTLENSILRVLEIAPETRGAEALISVRKGALQQAGAWPNPQIELRIDDKIGKNDASGGNQLTQFVFSQPLPLNGRLGDQKAIAAAQLDAARAERHYQQLRLESQVAQRYHSLQLATDRLRLAEQRLQLADELQEVGRRREQAGELSRLERLRLDLIRESAQQILDKMEGKTNEALSQFRAYLDLAPKTTPLLSSLAPFGPIPTLAQWQAYLPQHAALLAAQHQLEAARSGVNLARTERLPDPTLRLFRERDYLNGRAQDVTGIGIGISVPLWDRKTGRLSEARGQVSLEQSKLQVLKRDLASRLQQSYLHLNHLIEQGKHFKIRVFEPAQQVFDLTRKAYASGEVEILSLIDANNTYFDARERYLELLQEAWLEAAELRLAAGRTLVTALPNTQATTKQDNQS